jgi:hypothetical protein
MTNGMRNLIKNCKCFYLKMLCYGATAFPVMFCNEMLFFAICYNSHDPKATIPCSPQLLDFHLT